MCRACATSSFCPLCTPAQPSSCSTVVLSRSISLVVPLGALSGGPTLSVHANVLPSPVLTRAYSVRISSGRGGIAPPVQRGAAHSHTNPAARAAGGEPPHLKAPRALRASRKCSSSSGPGGHTPVSAPQAGAARYLVSVACCLGQLLAPTLCPTNCRRAHTHTHTLRHHWACQCGTSVHLFHARLFFFLP